MADYHDKSSPYQISADLFYAALKTFKNSMEHNEVSVSLLCSVEASQVLTCFLTLLDILSGFFPSGFMTKTTHECTLCSTTKKQAA
jgi:hypothetical protein